MSSFFYRLLNCLSNNRSEPNKSGKDTQMSYNQIRNEYDGDKNFVDKYESDITKGNNGFENPMYQSNENIRYDSVQKEMVKKQKDNGLRQKIIRLLKKKETFEPIDNTLDLSDDFSSMESSNSNITENSNIYDENDRCNGLIEQCDTFCLKEAMNESERSKFVRQKFVKNGIEKTLNDYKEYWNPQESKDFDNLEDSRYSNDEMTDRPLSKMTRINPFNKLVNQTEE
ncbi:hypothetical protein M153_24140001108 [Pseudoloma neurophilia]|uniref:Uncharacterized protein n=1 Tax=Pseudoloma neurophilia TaxID=146866 RepID=A0A0R0LUE5_9MICR|nr:hypothetical protein M153_24140001108 [Pseudoloma neurophilia]